MSDETITTAALSPELIKLEQKIEALIDYCLTLKQDNHASTAALEQRLQENQQLASDLAATHAQTIATLEATLTDFEEENQTLNALLEEEAQKVHLLETKLAEGFANEAENASLITALDASEEKSQDLNAALGESSRENETLKTSLEKRTQQHSQLKYYNIQAKERLSALLAQLKSLGHHHE